MTPVIDLAWWRELLIALAVGSTAVVLASDAACRLVASPTWQRMLWQAATIGLLLVALLEFAGAGTVAAVLLLIALMPLVALRALRGDERLPTRRR